jgi:simple sugar transport system substrate-binding protein
METKLVRFINRTKELKTIVDSIKDWNSRYAVFVHGNGGVGKTRFVREAIENLRRQLAQVSEKQRYEERTITVGVLLLTSMTGWGRLFLEGCQSMAAELGIEIFVEDAENNLDELVSGFDRLVAHHPDAIIIDLGRGRELQQSVTAALQGGICILTVGSELEGEGLIEVSQDELHLALLSLQPIIEDLDAEGDIVVCWNPGPMPLETRRKILDETLKRYPKIKIVAEVGLDQGGGEILDASTLITTTTEQIIQVIREHPALKAIWASTGEYGMTAMQALEITGRTDINLYSIDFDERTYGKMSQPNSPWKLTAATNPLEIGRIMVRVATSAVYGESPRKKYFVPIHVITREMIQTISSLGMEGSLSWAEGSGVGWSPSLRAIMSRRGVSLRDGLQQELIKSDISGQSWLLLDILDLDDIRLRSPQDLAMAIVNQLGSENFRSYLAAIQNLRTIEIKNPSQYENQKKVVEELFLQTLAGLSTGYRIVITCDTTEALEASLKENVVHYLLRIINYMSNSIIIISGRNAQQIMMEFDNNPELTKSQLVVLEPFDSTASKEYFEVKQDVLSVQLGLSPEEIEKIILLSRGLPIQIDLAVDWLTRGLFRTWLAQHSLENLRNLPDDALELKRAEFEEQLVVHIQRLREQLDRLVLALAWVKPMDPRLCAHLIKVSLQEAGELIEEASKLSFIKVLPDGRIKLHDYVQDMIRKYVWPKIGADRRIYTSQLAAEYYVIRMSELKQEAEALQDADIKKDAILREYWQIGAELIIHAFHFDAQFGVGEFTRLFDEATKDYRINLREALVEAAYRNLSLLFTRDEQYPVIRRKVRHLVDTGHYEDAIKVAEEYLAGGTDLADESYVDILTQLADCNRILGRLQKSHLQFLQVLELCQKNKSLSSRIPRIETNLGQVLRLMGDLDGAERYYLNAQDKTNDPALISSILNNLSYVVMLQGHFNRAKNYCQESLYIREQNKLEREIGISHLTMGEIYRNWARFEDALREYGIALSIFERENDVFWLSQVNVHLGSTYRILDRLDEAKDCLSKSLSYKVPLQEPYVFHALGCIWWDKGDKDQALKQFELSDKAAENLELESIFSNNLLALAEMLYETWVESNYTNLQVLALIHEKANKFKETVPNGFLHHRGRMLKVEADVFFDEGNYQSAKELYIQAYKLLGIRKGGYGKRTFDDELLALQVRIVEHLGREDPNLALDWCQELKARWGEMKPPFAWQDDLIDICSLCERRIRIAASRSN